MTATEYLGGLAFYIATSGSVAVAAVAVARHWMRGAKASERWLAVSVLFTAGVVGVHLVPGLLGRLDRASALAMAGVVLVAAALGFRRSAQRASEPRMSEAAARVHILPALALLVVAVVVAIGAFRAAQEPSMSVDALDFHGPTVARWIQTGSMWNHDQFSPYRDHGSYPQNGDVIYLSATLPWRSDAYARLLQVPYLAIAVLAVYALAQRLGASRSMAALSGGVFASLPNVIHTTLAGGFTDVIFLAMLGAGATFLWRSETTSARFDLLLGGVGLGLALGTKWYGVWVVPIVVCTWFCSSLLTRRRSAGATLAGAVWLSGTITLSGGFWFVRNAIATGNPVGTARVKVLGYTLFDAPRDLARECVDFSIAHYLTAPSVLREYVGPAFASRFGIPGLALVIAAAAGVIVVVRDRRQSRTPVLAVYVVLVLLSLSYLIAPLGAFGLEGRPVFVSANTRYGLPALMSAAIVGAWTASRLPRPATVLAEMGGFIAVLGGLVALPTVSRATVIGAVGAAAAIWLVVRTETFRTARADRGVVVAVVTMTLATMALTGFMTGRRFAIGRYEGVEPAIDYIVTEAPKGRRIGIAGFWSGGLSPVLPSFGPRFDNSVEYVGETARGQLRPYMNRRAFGAAIARGRYDLLIVATEAAPAECGLPGLEGNEVAWAESLGFERLASGRHLMLFAVDGPTGEIPPG